MLAEGLATRYEFGGETVGDALMRRTAGRRLEDGRGVTLVVFEDVAGVGQAQGVKAVETAGALAGLKLSSVLACLEIGRDDDGHAYMVFESPDMPSLKSIIRERGGLSPAEALDIVHAVATVLSRTASVGVHHQDISSFNIYCNLLDGGPLKVSIGGFGLASLLPSYSPMKKTSPYYGNAEYMAPEVCSGRPGSPSSDLYALGILMYEMVTGKPPFVSAGASTTIKRQVYEKPLPLHLVKPGLHQLDSYEALVVRLLAKDPTGRPASAAEVVDIISRLKNEVFFDLTLAVEGPREDYPAVVSTFVEAMPQPDQMSGTPGATMAFEGLSEAVAKMIEAQESAAAKEAAASSAEGSEVGVKTEAFDASFIASVVEQAAAGGDIGEAIAEARSRSAGGAGAEAKAEQSGRKVKSTKKAPKVKAEKVVEPKAKPAPVKKDTRQSQTVMKKPVRGGKKSGAVVVVVVIALAVLLAIGIAFWWKNRTAEVADPSGVQSGVVVPAADREKEAADALHSQALEKVRLGRMMFDRGDLAGASAAAVEALRIEKGCAEALKLQSDIDAAQPAPPADAAPAANSGQAPLESDQAVPVVYKSAAGVPVQIQPASAGEARQAVTTPPVRTRRPRPASTAPLPPGEGVEAMPAPVPAATLAPAADPRIEANALRAKARKAYKAGDCATAVSLLEQIRAMGQFNDLDAGVMKKCANKSE